jgi:hypothetical protein
VDWAAFCRFISDFNNIKAADVSGRYNYGELRLSSLNFYAPFFLGKFNFEQIHVQAIWGLFCKTLWPGFLCLCCGDHGLELDAGWGWPSIK